MNILVVGNILKDVYLGLDPRNENFERDKNNVNWLNLGFDASSHHFFRRTASFGGAAVSLEVLQKMGLPAEIVKQAPDDDSKTTEIYRYILTYDDNVSYFTPSNGKNTPFVAPDLPLNYLYIDRSAELSAETAKEIESYLDLHPTVKLVVYLKNSKNLENLAKRANLVFCENNRGPSELKDALSSTKNLNLSSDKIVWLSPVELSYKGKTEPISVNRIDTLTHLSLYNIAAATILGSFILGETVEGALKMAKVNVENSTLNSTLSLEELHNLVATLTPDDNLELIAASLVLPKKGILAADESGGSIKKKFEQLNIADTFENRHFYRNIFFTTPHLEDSVNGIILFDETARDFADNGQTYIDFLTSKRIIPGIKVDQGLAPLSELVENPVENSVEETYTKGLDGLESRLKEYYQMGLRFAKWRAAFTLTLSDIGEIITPTNTAIFENCRILAEYAKKCQSAGLVPIVEPEVVYDGYYTIEKCAEATGKILDELFSQLADYKVDLKACILKVNMILAGKQMRVQSTPEAVGRATATVLKHHVPSDLAGVVFLSGGQTVDQATDNLAAVQKYGPFPWPVTFSFARALQDPALFAWSGNANSLDKARSAFAARLKKNTEVL